MGVREIVVLLALVSVTSRADDGHVYRGLVHVHSRLSHDSRGTFSGIAAAAREAGADFVMLTDHPGGGAPQAQPRGLRDGVLFIPGLETHRLLALGVALPLSAASPASLVEEIHRQGGLVVAAHPATFTDWRLQGLDGMEVYDVLDDVRDEFLPWAILRWSWRRWRDPAGALASILDYPAANLARWDTLCDRLRLTGIAGVDAHQNISVAGWQVDPYASLFRFVQTWLLSPRLDERSLLAALRAGRAMVVYTVFGDPGRVAFNAHAGRGGAGIGGSLGTRLPARLSIAVDRPCRVKVVRNGTLFWSQEVTTRDRFEIPAPSPGSYRLELWTKDGRRDVPWVLTNPIRIMASP